jgi:hypothetical protein
LKLHWRRPSTVSSSLDSGRTLPRCYHFAVLMADHLLLCFVFVLRFV